MNILLIVTTLVLASCMAEPAEPEANAEVRRGFGGGFGRHYGGFGGFGGNRHGHGYHKRSADSEPEATPVAFPAAEADAAATYIYDTSYIAPTYATFPLAYYAEYNPYSYTLDTPIAYAAPHLIGKREAEAEPQYYGGFGGFGGGYGGYGGYRGGFGGFRGGFGGHRGGFGGGYYGGRRGYGSGR